jgi:hypothetical protein
MGLAAASLCPWLTTQPAKDNMPLGTHHATSVSGCLVAHTYIKKMMHATNRQKTATTMSHIEVFRLHQIAILLISLWLGGSVSRPYICLFTFVHLFGSTVGWICHQPRIIAIRCWAVLHNLLVLQLTFVALLDHGSKSHCQTPLLIASQVLWFGSRPAPLEP